MIFVIDTSSSIAALATIDGELRTELLLPARSPELHAALSRIARSGGITKVAVATGPGSFTGLRVGVAFGLGLAMGLGVPIVPLGTLPLQVKPESELRPFVDAAQKLIETASEVPYRSLEIEYMQFFSAKS
ncbi:MAG: hypothetical protein E6I72_01250 [Chloroflexi bacterium]|nr:MAG: hypothetical protein E6I72_01250 [Chloroflexota bacterium]